MRETVSVAFINFVTLLITMCRKLGEFYQVSTIVVCTLSCCAVKIYCLLSPLGPFLSSILLIKKGINVSIFIWDMEIFHRNPDQSVFNAMDFQ